MIYVNVFNYDSAACGFYRLKQPYMWLNKTFPDIAVKFIHPTDPETALIDMLNCDVLALGRIWTQNPQFIPNILNEAKRMGVISLYDIDDKDWALPKENNLYELYKTMQIDKYSIAALTAATHVTCTTRILKKSIQQFNKNVTVIPNAIDYESPIWNIKRNTQNDGFINVGYVGGSSHLHDLMEVKGIGKWLLKTFDNVKFHLCGYDTRQFTGDKIIHVENMENVWWQYIDVLFEGYSDTKRLILKPTMPLDTYPSMYSDLDIVIAPLKNIEFNKNKSELKLIEASGYGIPIVASNIPPYSKSIISGINGYLCNNIQDFKRYLTKLIKDKDLRQRLGTKLKESYKKKYDIRVTSATLHDLILSLYKEKHDGRKE